MQLLGQRTWSLPEKFRCQWVHSVTSTRIYCVFESFPIRRMKRGIHCVNYDAGWTFSKCLRVSWISFLCITILLLGSLSLSSWVLQVLTKYHGCQCCLHLPLSFDFCFHSVWETFSLFLSVIEFIWKIISGTCVIPFKKIHAFFCAFITLVLMFSFLIYPWFVFV